MKLPLIKTEFQKEVLIYNHFRVFLNREYGKGFFIMKLFLSFRDAYGMTDEYFREHYAKKAMDLLTSIGSQGYYKEFSDGSAIIKKRLPLTYHVFLIRRAESCAENLKDSRKTIGYETYFAKVVLSELLPGTTINLWDFFDKVIVSASVSKVFNPQVRFTRSWRKNIEKFLKETAKYDDIFYNIKVK